MSRYLFVFLLVLATRSLLADDFKTIDGKEYKNVKVSRSEPDGIVLITSAGISKVYFTELPKEVQERFHYDAVKAAAYSAQQNANVEALRKQQQQAAEAKAKNDKYAAEQLSAAESANTQWNTVQALQARLKASTGRGRLVAANWRNREPTGIFGTTFRRQTSLLYLQKSGESEFTFPP